MGSLDQSVVSLSLVLARFALVLARSTHHIISMQQPMDDTPQHNKSQQTVPPSLTYCSRPMSRQQPPRHAPHTKTNAKHTPPTYTNTHTHTHIRHIRIGQYTMYHLSDTQLTDLQDHTIHNPQLFGQVLHISLKRS